MVGRDRAEEWVCAISDRDRGEVRTGEAGRVMGAKELGELNETQVDRKARKRKALAALGLPSTHKLPKCPHRSWRKAVKLGAPHTDAGHVCNECRCDKSAGTGTPHVGVGYCYIHERRHPKRVNQEVATNMANAIQQGYPDKPYRYIDNSEYAEEIQRKADECETVLSAREEAIVIQTQIQRLIKEMSDPNSSFTESTKNGPQPASDGYKIAILTKLTATYATLAKLEFQITDDRYVPVEQVMSWIASFVRIIEQKIPKELYDEIIEEVKKVPQPRSGRRKK
jgi:hypothetical protein